MASSTGYAGSALAQTEREPSLNARLNRISERLQEQCERIEAVLARVNGTPQKIESAGRGSNPVPPTPTLPMASVIEHLESVQSRLIELAAGVERIA